MSALLDGFDEEARTQVNSAIAAAEKQTAAEILPVVAATSGSYDRAEDIVGLWCGLTLTGVAWFLFQGVTAGSGWASEWVVGFGFWWVLLLMLVGYVGGVVLADRVDGLRRLFAPAREMESETVARAKAVFFDRRLHATSQGTGVLLYVSLLERRAVVLVDDAVAEKLDEKALEEIRDELLAGLREGSLAKGFNGGIQRVGSLLAESLPAGENRKDEVPSEVVVLT